MKKFLIILPLLFFATAPVFSQTVSDTNDFFEVISPSANQKVKGIIDVNFRMFDNNQNIINFSTELWDGATCRTNNFGSITSMQSAVSNILQTTNFSWNTKSTNSTSSLADGKYCLKICGAFLNGSVKYNACNSRIVSIVNYNRLPVITSVPSNLTIFETGYWEYQLLANDPDSDPLIYRFVQSVPFLSIDPLTGKIFTNSTPRVLPLGVNKIDYTIIVAVDDNMSGSIHQQFNLSLIKLSTQHQPETISPQIPVTPPQDEEPIINYPTKIRFISPESETSFVVDTFLIQFSVTDLDGIKTVKLSFSKDLLNWETLKTFESDITNYTYNWDVSQLEPGEYFLRVESTDKKGDTLNRISYKIIKSEEIFEEEKTILIVNTRPFSSSVNENLKPVISGEIISEKELNLESFKITLNTKDITELCILEEEKFICQIQTDLEEGINEVEVYIENIEKEKGTFKWNFETKAPFTPKEKAEQTQRTISLLGIEIQETSLLLLILLCLVCGILIIIPWILYFLWVKSKKEITKKEEENNLQIFGTPEIETDIEFKNIYPESELSQKNDNLKEILDLEKELEQENTNKKMESYIEPEIFEEKNNENPKN